MTYQSFDGHGVDVALKRADDLDKRVLAYIAEHPGCTVLDVGSGAGGQSVRMATAGATVTAIDQFDFTQQFATYGFGLDQLEFIMGDMQKLTSMLSNKKYAVTLCQRTIHYLPYKAAYAFLVAAHTHTTDTLFISVTGVDSLIGDVYPAKAHVVTDRFGPLSDLGKEMFLIQEPVCLYNKNEFETLLKSAGWIVDACWVSAFGNIKAVCSKE